MPQTTEFKLGVDGVAAFEFSDGTTKTVDLANVSGGGASVDASTMSTALSSTDAAGRASFRNSGAISTHAGTVASESAMLTIANIRVGDTVKRTDTGTDWRCDALPSSTLGNWRNLATSGGSTTIVNDLTTGGTSSALSAEMGKQLQNTKAPAVNASPVVGAGVTSLTRTPVTTSGAEAPTGYYNRPLISDHSVTVDVTGAVVGDALMILNSSGSNITLTASGAVVTIPAGKTGEVAYNGTSWIDPAQSGSSYTDSQALAAAVLSGVLGTDTTKAPTHSAVTNAIASAGVGGGNVSTIAPTAFSTVPVSTTRGVLASVTVPANTLGARGLLKVLAEYSKSGATDAGSYSIRLGAIGGTSATAIEIGLLNTTAANTVASIAVHIRAVGSALVVLKNSPGPWGSLTSATSVAVDQSAGFVVYFCATTLTTDTASLIGAHVEYSKVA